MRLDWCDLIDEMGLVRWVGELGSVTCGCWDGVVRWLVRWLMSGWPDG